MKPYNYLTQNAKMKKSTGVPIFNWGIPAFKAKSGFKTCPMAGTCVVGCYATMGAYTFSNVKPAFERRLALARSKDLTMVLDSEIKRRGIGRVRIHDSGDFFNLTYTRKWFSIAELNPDVHFYAYTKMVSLFERLNIPPNFTTIYSYGGKQDTLIKPEEHRHAKVFETLEELLAEGYVDASGDDAIALGVNPKIGLIYHGTKNYENTEWKKVA